MRRYNLVCPNENVVLGTVVKAKKHIVNLTNPEGMVNVIYSALFIVATDILSITFVISEVLIEHLDAVVTVATDKRVRKLAVHNRDSFLCGSPLFVCSFLLIIRMTDVNTVLGDVTKSDYILNVLSVLVIYNPLIYRLKKLGILVVDSLRIAYERKAVRIVILDRLYVLCLPEKLLIGSIISVTGYVCKSIVLIFGRNLIASEKSCVSSVESAGIIGCNLFSASYVRVKTKLLDEALEVLVLSVLPILAVTLCVTESCISTDEELLLKRIVAIGEHVLGKSLFEFAVNVAACLTCLGVVNNGKMLPCACSEVYVCKSVIRGFALCIGVRKTWITVSVYLKQNASAVVAAIVTYYGTTNLAVVIIGHKYPSFKGFDIRLDILINFIFAEVLHLNTTAVVVYKGVAVSGIVTERSHAHLGKVVSSDKTVGVAPALCSCHIALNLTRTANVVIQRNGINQALEIVGVA